MERIWIVTKDDKGVNKEPIKAFVDQLAAAEFVESSDSYCTGSAFDKKLIQLDDSFPINIQFYECDITVGKSDWGMSINQFVTDAEVIDILNNNAENISNSIANTIDSGEIEKSTAKLFFLARKADVANNDFHTLFTTSLYDQAIKIIQETIKATIPATPVMEPTMRFTKIIPISIQKRVELVDSDVRERLLKVLNTIDEQNLTRIFG